MSKVKIEKVYTKVKTRRFNSKSKTNRLKEIFITHKFLHQMAIVLGQQSNALFRSRNRTTGLSEYKITVYPFVPLQMIVLYPYKSTCCTPTNHILVGVQNSNY